jgi:hypothetical protein
MKRLSFGGGMQDSTKNVELVEQTNVHVSHIISRDMSLFWALFPLCTRNETKKIKFKINNIHSKP